MSDRWERFDRTLTVWQARMNADAVGVLPWDCGTPVESHMAAEGML